MKVRRLVLAFAVLMAGPAIWAASAEPANAGGPTSVLLSNPADGRVGALYHDSADYRRLVDLVGAYDPASGQTDRPAVVRDNVDAYRLAWMIHDMTVWRIDLLYETDDGIWLETKVEPSGMGDIFAREGRWNHLDGEGKAALSAVFHNAGILGEAPEVMPAAADTPATGPSAGALAAAAGVAGLVIGAGGVLLLRRVRSASGPPRAVLSG
jgi:LPXTG-motif cell wall-anchored protein